MTCPVCSKGLAKRVAALREAGCPGPAARVRHCSKKCEHEANLLRRRLQARKEHPRQVYWCVGAPEIKVVTSDVVLFDAPAKPCGLTLSGKLIKRCRACAKETDRRSKAAGVARKRGPRWCIDCGDHVPCGQKLMQRCSKCSKELRHEHDRYRKPPKSGPRKPKKAAPHDKAAEDFDVLRLLQEDSHDYCATKEAWASRVGRDPGSDQTDRQWSRLKVRLRAHGYKIEDVEFDMMAEQEGRSVNRKGFGIRVRR